MKQFCILSIPLTVWMFAQPTSGVPLTWTLEDVTFNDGGTATGYFVWDADLDNSLVAINIHASSWGIHGEAHYTMCVSDTQFDGNCGESLTLPGRRLSAASDELLALMEGDLFGDLRWLSLQFESPLTNQGGTVVLEPGDGRSWEFYHDHECGGDCRNVTGGFVTAVPEPTTSALLTLGVTGLALSRRATKRR